MSYIADEIVRRIYEQAKNRCGYCLSPQKLVAQKLQIEHISPKSKGGLDEESNLWLACGSCNGFKSSKISGFDKTSAKFVKLFNPRYQHWKRHFKFDETKTMIIGKTACERATIEALKMNNDLIVPLRKLWINFDKFPPEGY